MSYWEQDYDDAFDDAYDEEDDGFDDYDDKPLAPPKKAAQKSAPVNKKNARQSTVQPDQAGTSSHRATDHLLDEESSSATVPVVQKGSLIQAPLSDYRMDAELERLCHMMKETHLYERPTLHLVILGHVDAGKSTLMGRLLHDLGFVNEREQRKTAKQATESGKASFSWAWVLDERPEERARGVTVDVAMSHFQTGKLNVVLLDAPGHRDFVPNMISGASQADAAILAVDGSINGFEAGFQTSGSGFRSQGGGQTREHAQLARSLGIEQLAVVITKLDSCNYAQERFEEIQSQLQPFLMQCGFKRDAIQWLLCVAPDGVNLLQAPSDEPRLAWYRGPTVLEAIDSFKPVSKNISAPFRLPVGEIVKSRSLGNSAVSGKIEAGAVRIGSGVVITPSGDIATVKAIETHGQKQECAKAGESCSIGLSDVKPHALFPGCVICTEGWPCAVTSRLECRVVVLEPPIPILPGLQVSLQAHTLRESGRISRLISLLDAKTGEEMKSKPRCLTNSQTALIEIITSKPICVETYADFRALGRITVRESGRTIAVGIIVKTHNS